MQKSRYSHSESELPRTIYGRPTNSSCVVLDSVSYWMVYWYIKEYNKGELCVWWILLPWIEYVKVGKQYPYWVGVKVRPSRWRRLKNVTIEREKKNLDENRFFLFLIDEEQSQDQENSSWKGWNQHSSRFTMPVSKKWRLSKKSIHSDGLLP